jgi:Domain of unknown function (DUF5658)
VKLWLTIAFVVVQLLDVATTRVGLALGLPEGNPVAVMLLQRFGETRLFEAKLLFALFMVASLVVLGRRWNGLWRVGLPLAVCVTSITVLGNCAVIVSRAIIAW